jgi:two-component system, chemotaxis family, CheB/CheR fusion protein
MTAADGSRRWFEAWGEPIRSDGKPKGGVVTIRDITDRSVYRLQQEFTALASHELRGPLSVVVGALQIAQMHLSRSDAGDQAKAKIGESLAMAQWEADRMMLLVNDLLDMRRLQTGKLKLRLEPVDLVPHVRRTVAGVKLATAARSVVLDVKVGSLLVMGDASRLEQILLNLLNNAIQHAAHAERIEVRLRQVNDAAELQVQDDGPGIPPHELPKIFSRYYQVARLDQQLQTGLGLGLYITKELVTLHGGTIDVESQEGVGTRFTVKLPTLREGGASQTVQATDGASATS